MMTNAGQVGAVDESIEQVKQRFALWRAGRKRGEHVSTALWTAAVGLVERHGLVRTARELRIDSDGLKKRCAHGTVSNGAGKAQPQFVELFAPSALNATPAVKCIILMENGSGATMRVELKSLDGLVELSSAFWRAR